MTSRYFEPKRSRKNSTQNISYTRKEAKVKSGPVNRAVHGSEEEGIDDGAGDGEGEEALLVHGGQINNED